MENVCFFGVGIIFIHFLYKMHYSSLLVLWCGAGETLQYDAVYLKFIQPNKLQLPPFWFLDI